MNYKLFSLVAFVFFSWNNFAQSDVAYHEVSFEKLKNAIKIYFIDCGNYPKTLDVLSGEQGCEKWESRNYKDFSLHDIWGREYQYTYPSSKYAGQVKYELYSYGEDGIECTKDDIANWLPPELWRTYYMQALSK